MSRSRALRLGAGDRRPTANVDFALQRPPCPTGWLLCDPVGGRCGHPLSFAFPRPFVGSNPGVASVRRRPGADKSAALQLPIAAAALDPKTGIWLVNGKAGRRTVR